MILVHPAAAEEARDARLRYAQQDQAVARRFLREYDRALERVRDHPERWPLYPHLSGGFRWCRFRRFPYAVIYEIVPPDIHVLAVAADKPGHKLLSVQQALVISCAPGEFDSRRLHHFSLVLA